MTIAVAVTAFADKNPGPRIRVDVTGLPAGVLVTVHRIADETGTVLDAVRKPGLGAFTVVDYLAPLGVPVTYRAETFDAVTGISLGFSDGATTTIPWDASMGWFSDPLVPGNAVEVELKSDFGDSLNMGRSLRLHGVGTRVVALMGTLTKLSNVNLHCQTKKAADTIMLREVLNAGVVCIRTAPLSNVPTIPRLLTVAVGPAPRVDMDVQYGGAWSRWPISGDEISPMELDIAVPVVTWQNYIDAFPTWADFNAAYLTWFDAIQNPPGV